MYGFSSFSEAPFSALALNDYQLACGAGSYTLTGSSASFVYAKTIQGGAGSYALTGNAASFAYNQVLHCDAGSYALTGSDATFLYNQVLNGNAGSYELTGNSATFAYNQVIYAGAFNFAWTGNDAGLRKSYVLNALAGSYALDGKAATFTRTRVINGSAGNYVYSGKDATLNYNPIVVVVESKGGIGKKEKKKREAEKASREELEAIVKREFDILDGTYQPEVVEVAKQAVLPQIKEIDYTQYQIALAQVNALLLQAKIRAAEYESELDDEEALLMLL